MELVTRVVKDNTVAEKLVNIPNMIHKITPFVDYNKWLKRLDTLLNNPSNKNLVKVLKVD